MIDDRYNIDTPEHISFDYDVAGIGSRFLAAFIDSALLYFMLGVLNWISVLVANAALPDLLDGLASVLLGGLALLNFLLFWGYYMFFELAWNGQSLGKRMIGVRVVREGGRPITLSAAAIRNLVRVVDFLPFFYGIGVVTMFIDGRSRRLGDLAAGTIVVKERRTVSLAELANAIPPTYSGSASFTPTLPNLERLTAEDYDLVQSFLRRRSDLNLENRRRLASQLATRLRARLEIEPGAPDEAILQQIAAEYAVMRRNSEAVRG